MSQFEHEISNMKIPICFVLIVKLVTSCFAVTDENQWQLTDSIDTPYFVYGENDNPLYGNWPSLHRRIRTWRSPDHQKILIFTYRGNRDRDSNIYTARIYRIADLEKALSEANAECVPLTTFDFESFSSSSLAIMGVKWDDDSRHIIFIGAKEAQEQLYVFDISTSQLSRVSDIADHIAPGRGWYRNGAVVLHVLVEPNGSTSASYPLVPAVRRSEGFLVLGSDAQRGASSGAKAYSKWLAHGKSGTWRVVQDCVGSPAISPDGTWAIATLMLQSDPSRRVFVAIDLDAGTVTPLISDRLRSKIQSGEGNADNNAFAKWETNGKTVRLVNVVHRDDSDKKIYGAAIWNSETGHLTETADQNNMPITAHDDVSGRVDTDLSFEIVGDANTPPRLEITSRSHAERTATLIDLEKLGAKKLKNEFELFTWKSNKGVKLKGRLCLPTDWKNRQGMPVVIQNSSLETELECYRPDGPTAAAYAASEFARRGYVVLEIECASSSDKDEGPDFVDRLDSAVDELEQRFPINRNRIAAIGHSRTGFQILYAATHPGKTKLAAGIAVDSTMQTFAQWINYGGMIGMRTAGDLEGFYNKFQNMAAGGFWADRESWLKHDVVFNADKCTTPLLLTCHTPLPWNDKWGYTGDSGTVDYRSLIAALNFNHIPAEFIWIPTGRHVLVRPRERLELLQVACSWVDFWCRDIEPSDALWRSRWAALPAWARHNASEPRTH